MVVAEMDPPPETLTMLLTWTAAFPATFTVTTIAG
jgi:ABC-type uncharacterized transport system YnjBCD substrate-binding protein